LARTLIDESQTILCADKKCIEIPGTEEGRHELTLEGWRSPAGLLTLLVRWVGLWQSVLGLRLDGEAGRL